MIKEKRILSYFIGWFLLGFIICFIGVNKIFADEMERVGFLSDKSDIKVVVPYNGAPLTLNQYGEYMLTEANELLIFIDNYDFARDNIYQLELYMPNATLTNANTFIVAGSNSTNNNVSCRAIKILQDNKQYVNFRWSCNENVNSLTFTVKNSNNENIVKSGIFRWDYTFLWNVLTTSDNSDVIVGLDKLEQSIVDSNKETQEVIKDQFNSCRDSLNLFNKNIAILSSYIDTSGEIISPANNFAITDFISVNQNETYTYSGAHMQTSFGAKGAYYDENKNFISYFNMTTSRTITIPEGAYYIRFSLRSSSGDLNTFQFQKGSVATKYEAYDEKVCTNKLDEQNETSKGILGKIGDLISYINPASENFFVYKLIDLLLDLLKRLFIPEDGYFKTWFDELKIFFELKLGFLATPFTIIIDFVNRYLELNPSSDIVINIPNITVPNFENHVIVEATSFNWSELLQSKESFNTLWQLYLSFVDVFLILNFINLCENKYNRIFGGDTTNYEYYTVEDSYNVDVNTGEVKSMRRNERKTTRKKVD